MITANLQKWYTIGQRDGIKGTCYALIVKTPHNETQAAVRLAYLAGYADGKFWR